MASIYAPKGLFSMPEGVDNLFFRFTVGYYNIIKILGLINFFSMFLKYISFHVFGVFWALFVIWSKEGGEKC